MAFQAGKKAADAALHAVSTWSYDARSVRGSPCTWSARTLSIAARTVDTEPRIGAPEGTNPRPAHHCSTGLKVNELPLSPLSTFAACAFAPEVFEAMSPFPTCFVAAGSFPGAPLSERR